MVSKKCKVCGRRLNIDCKRYGGQACTACATFFMRFIKRSNRFLCSNYNLCLAIPTLTGSSCRKCRYQRCLEIGMIHGRVAQSNEKRIKKCGEYYVLSKKLNNLFITIQASPQLLFNYLEREDRTLFDKAFELLPKSSLTNYLLPWAELLQKNQMPLNKAYVLFYSIVCKIQIPNLSFQDQFRLIHFQKSVAQKELTQENYGSDEIREGFEKLAYFFACEYQKIFGNNFPNLTKKLSFVKSL